MKLIHTIVFFLLTSFIYGQKSTLFQNINFRADELKHYLNTSEDRIILRCERDIFEVVIYNDDFERVINVEGSEVQIPISDVPVGRYVVEVALSDKLIVITLVRHEPLEAAKTKPLSINANPVTTRISPKKDVIDSVMAAESIVREINKSNTQMAGKGDSSETEVLKSGNQRSNPNNSTLLDSPKELVKKPIKAYWIHYQSNNGTRSEKVQRLGDQQLVDRLIKKIEIDMKTETGRLNKLSIWEVYDPPAFITHKRFHKKNYTEIPSESFNIKPYYQK